MILQELCFNYLKISILDQESNVDKDGSIIWIQLKKGNLLLNLEEIGLKRKISL